MDDYSPFAEGGLLRLTGTPPRTRQVGGPSTMTPQPEPWTVVKSVRLRLPAHLWDPLTAEADATGATVSDLIRQALTERNERK